MHKYTSDQEPELTAREELVTLIEAKSDSPGPEPFVPSTVPPSLGKRDRRPAISASDLVSSFQKSPHRVPLPQDPAPPAALDTFSAPQGNTSQSSTAGPSSPAPAFRTMQASPMFLASPKSNGSVSAQVSPGNDSARNAADNSGSINSGERKGRTDRPVSNPDMRPNLTYNFV
jgi:hypothetical protein